MKLLNKCAIVTGANQGFGLAVAELFLLEGANVILCARNSEKLAEAEASLAKLLPHSSKLICLVGDISNPPDNQKLVEYAEKYFHGVDILVANAGVHGPKGKIEEIDWEEWSQAIDINLKGTVLTCRSVIPVMKKKKKGKIIILSGGGATKPMPFLSAYASSKAAIVRFAETLSEELKEFNIDVNALAPGAMNTRLLDDVLESGPEKVGSAFYEQLLKQKENGGVPLQKGANLCLYLACEESNGISGKLISAVWDPWQNFNSHHNEIMESDVYTLRRIVPEDRAMKW